VAGGRGRSRRVSIPGVAELLRPATPDPVHSDERQATGREKHDQKITVYLSATELLDLEHARLALRRFGLVIDRGRLVREAIAIMLADLDARGKDSALARRIRASRNGHGADGASGPHEAAGSHAADGEPEADESVASGQGVAGNGHGDAGGERSAASDEQSAAGDERSAPSGAHGADAAASPLPSLAWRRSLVARCATN
jgi:hypothetical protein